MKKTLTSIGLILFTLGSGSAAWAQTAPEAAQPPTQATQTTPQAQASEPANISDGDIAKFAQAQTEVQGINSEYSQKLQDASGDAQKAQQVQHEATEKMIKAVERTGLDVDTYNQIAQAAQHDAQLRERIQSVN